MRFIARQIIRFFREEDGPTTVEYAMMIMLIFLACLTSIILLGQNTAANFQQSSNSIDAAFNK